MRRALLTVLVSSFASIVGCAEPASNESTDDATGAFRAGADLLTMCPGIEDQLFTTIVDGDARVAQSYTQPSYTRQDGSVIPSRRVTNPIPASAVYQVRFYRDGRGGTRFSFSIGTFYGAGEGIEGPKQLNGSGTVEYTEGSSFGQLVFTSRRDNLQAVVGPVTKLRFDDFDCSGEARRMTLTAPVVTLEKASDATQTVTDLSGASSVVNTSVKWVKKATSAALTFVAPVG